MSKLLRFIFDFIFGMVVAAYLLSHTELGIQLYNKIAPMPTITKEQVQSALESAKKAGTSAIEIGGKLYNITNK